MADQCVFRFQFGKVGWLAGKQALWDGSDPRRRHGPGPSTVPASRAIGARIGISLFVQLCSRTLSRSIPELRQELTADGFEVGVHGLNHDGKLYSSKAEFDRRAKRINRYLKEWNAVGFRSPAMHHNLEWLKALNIEYDASTFDTDPFEPQPDGVGTIFPFWVARDDGTGYVELPYTLPQDFTLFVLMKERTIDIWKKKLDWIAEKGGMALIEHASGLHAFWKRKARTGGISG